MEVKRVSNYELFYDLVFVLATSMLTQLLHHISEQGLSLLAFSQFVVASFSIWFVWIAETMYLNKYSERGPHDVYAIIFSMLLLGNAASELTINWLSETVIILGIELPIYVSFNGLLLLTYGIILLQYYLYKRRRGVCNAAMQSHIRLILLTMGLITFAVAMTYFNIINGVLVFIITYSVIWMMLLFSKSNADYHQVNFPHMVERMQLITILTFGEAVIVLIQHYPIVQNGVVAVVSFVGMAFAFVSYISQTALNIEHHQEASPTLLINAHMTMLIGLNLYTVGIELMSEAHSIEVGVVLIMIGLFLFYSSLVATTVYNKAMLKLPLQVYGQYAALTMVAFTVMYLLRQSTEVFFVIVMLYTCLMAQIGYLYRRRMRRIAQESIVAES